ncbi:MAG: hypothetical protein GQ540_03330 [Lutibacter sp.]|uniref:hypothetical protein n=1 Tax=Lutibacter sp. TaxID=1925666 RepID=UPI001A07CCDA|nr:hypothetical protein [Lutibacter sp.]NOR27544.1 hypothetical protein [Lutibacter sp.]
MRNIFKCPKCGYKNYTDAKDNEKRKEELRKHNFYPETEIIHDGWPRIGLTDADNTIDESLANDKKTPLGMIIKKPFGMGKVLPPTPYLKHPDSPRKRIVKEDIFIPNPSAWFGENIREAVHIIKRLFRRN